MICIAGATSFEHSVIIKNDYALINCGENHRDSQISGSGNAAEVPNQLRTFYFINVVSEHYSRTH